MKQLMDHVVNAQAILFSEGHLESCDNCTDNEACSACDKTNGFCINCTEGHEYNPNTGNSTTSLVNTIH